MAAAPILPRLLGPTAIDAPSTNATCKYPPKPIAGAPLTAPGIFYKKTPLLYYADLTPAGTATGTPLVPIIPCVLPEIPRNILATTNRSVFLGFKKNPATALPAIFPGDSTVTVPPTTDRKITGNAEPYAPTVIFCSKVVK